MGLGRRAGAAADVRERSQGQVGAGDAARAQHTGDLVQVGAHRGHDLRVGDGQVLPRRQQQRRADACAKAKSDEPRSTTKSTPITAR
jgi:hypothetical protein